MLYHPGISVNVCQPPPGWSIIGAGGNQWPLTYAYGAEEMTSPMTQANVTDADPAIAVVSPNVSEGELPDGLAAADLVEVCRQMILVRAMDERIWMMNRQGKVPIAASCQGHEAAELGSLLAAQKDGDCFLFPYYRDLAVKMAAGLTPRQVMLSFMGKEGEPYSGARQFPLQGADLPRNIIQISNVVAAGLTQAVGYALACKMMGERTVTISYFGDGATSQGETHEAMNFRRHPPPAGHLHLREQQVRHIHAAGRADGHQRRCRPGRGLRISRICD